jgi:hypothetical protein
VNSLPTAARHDARARHDGSRHGLRKANNMTDGFKDDVGAVPFTPDGIPPIGHILVSVEGKSYWVKPAKLTPKLRDPGFKFQLSSEQIEKIKWAKDILKEHDKRTLEETVGSFMKDAHPDREIAIWEFIGLAYLCESKQRPNSTPQERALLFKALLLCSMTGDVSVGTLLSTEPALKKLPNLERLVEEWNNPDKIVETLEDLEEDDEEE